VYGIENDIIVPLIGASAKPALDEYFLRVHKKKTVAELNNLSEGGVFNVCAEVLEFVY
jgi:hypothetical protein